MVAARRKWFQENPFLPKTYAKSGSGSKNWKGKKDKTKIISEEHDDLASHHHKFPKRTLGWLWSRMTDPQRDCLRKALLLPSSSGANALKKLRSNLISPHVDDHTVNSDTRWDDPEHTFEFLDLVVIADTGKLTPRSANYLKLAYKYETIYQKLKDNADAMSEIDANEIISILQHAEVSHFSIVGSFSRIANYGKYWHNIKGMEEQIVTYEQLKPVAVLIDPSDSVAIEKHKKKEARKKLNVEKASRKAKNPAKNPTATKPVDLTRRWIKGMSTQKITDALDFHGYGMQNESIAVLDPMLARPIVQQQLQLIRRAVGVASLDDATQIYGEIVEYIGAPPSTQQIATYLSAFNLHL